MSQNSKPTLEEGVYVIKDGPLIVAQESAFTAVVADQVILEEGPTMVLNTDYKATTVPVPEGLAGGRVVLAQ